MSELTPFVSSFIIILLAELGDKTQIAVITLASRYKAVLILIGVVLAYVLVDGLSVVVGIAIFDYVPYYWVATASGIIFILFGIWTLLSKEGKESISHPKINSLFKGRETQAVLYSFVLITMMELGDKTQLATIVLSADYGSPILVFLGVLFAITLVTVVGIVIGNRIAKLLPRKYIKIGSAVVFIVFGILFLLNAYLN